MYSELKADMKAAGFPVTEGGDLHLEDQQHARDFMFREGYELYTEAHRYPELKAARARLHAGSEGEPEEGDNSMAEVAARHAAEAKAAQEAADAKAAQEAAEAKAAADAAAAAKAEADAASAKAAQEAEEAQAAADAAAAAKAEADAAAAQEAAESEDDVE